MGKVLATCPEHNHMARAAPQIEKQLVVVVVMYLTN